MKGPGFQTGEVASSGEATSISPIDASGMAGVQLEVTFEPGDDMSDQSGNGYDLATTLTESYILIDGKRCLYSREATRIDEVAGTGSSPNLKISGALTVYALVYINEPRMTGTPYVFAYGGTGENEGTNVQYAIKLDSRGFCEYFAEFGGGGSDIPEDLEYQMPTGRWTLFTLRRAADGKTCEIYHNGVEARAWVEANAPTGTGAASEFFSAAILGYFGGLVVCDAHHTPSEIESVAAQVGV